MTQRRCDIKILDAIEGKFMKLRKPIASIFYPIHLHFLIALKPLISHKYMNGLKLKLFYVLTSIH